MKVSSVIPETRVLAASPGPKRHVGAQFERVTRGAACRWEGKRWRRQHKREGSGEGRTSFAGIGKNCSDCAANLPGPPAPPTERGERHSSQAKTVPSLCDKRKTRDAFSKEMPSLFPLGRQATGTEWLTQSARPYAAAEFSDSDKRDFLKDRADITSPMCFSKHPIVGTNSLSPGRLRAARVQGVAGVRFSTRPQFATFSRPVATLHFPSVRQLCGDQEPAGCRGFRRVAPTIRADEWNSWKLRPKQQRTCGLTRRRARAATLLQELGCSLLVSTYWANKPLAVRASGMVFRPCRHVAQADGPGPDGTRLALGIRKKATGRTGGRINKKGLTFVNP